MQSQRLPSAVLPAPAPRSDDQHRPTGAPSPSAWSIEALAGRVVEIASHGGSAALSAVTALVVDAQTHGEPAAWIAVDGSVPFPPDLARAGVDLGALAFVRPRSLGDALRAADHLLRSGAFGAVVLDLGPHRTLRQGAQSRLAALARTHRSVLACLTRKRPGDPSVGALVSLRGVATASRDDDGRWSWCFRAHKDPRLGPGWTVRRPCRVPDGLLA